MYLDWKKVDKTALLSMVKDLDDPGHIIYGASELASHFGIPEMADLDHKVEAGTGKYGIIANGESVSHVRGIPGNVLLLMIVRSFDLTVPSYYGRGTQGHAYQSAIIAHLEAEIASPA